MLYKVNILIA